MSPDSLDDLTSNGVETNIVAPRAVPDVNFEKLVRPVNACTEEEKTGDWGDPNLISMAIFLLTNRGYDIDNNGESFE